MILRNNPRVDADELDARVAAVRELRRRPRIASAEAQSPPQSSSQPVSLEAGSRAGVGAVGDVVAAQAASVQAAGVEAPSNRGGAAESTPRATGWRSRIAALPLVGAVATFLGALLRLPGFRRDVADVHERMRAELLRLRDAQARLHEALAQQSHAQGEALQAQAGSADQQAQRIRRLEERCASLETRLATQTRSMRQLERAIGDSSATPGVAPPGASLPASSEPSMAAPGETPDRTTHQAGALGSFYAEFEHRFRGTREQIKARQRHYLPYLRQAIAGRPVPACVDVGCGRGEWLELLTGQGLAPVGLDLDAAMVDVARQAGLDARVGDGIDWLERQPQGSVDVVTAFQVIEHLPFDRLLRLLDAALRALAPEGVAIFETPNPENLLVATNSFYLDPTHRHPIPPPLAEFLAQQRGFARVELLRLNPLPAQAQLAGDDELTRRVNQLLYGAQDYALVAWKRGAGPAD